jgi:cyclohexanone monooxygenase
VAERFDLRKDIRFNTRVSSVIFDEEASTWQIATDGNESCKANFVVAATGCLSVPIAPEFPGADSFAGEVYHTGKWPHEEVDFTGKRVGVIGTGSSGIQSIPVIAEQADQLYVFQRTPSYSVPANNGPLDPQLQQRIKARYPEFREQNKKMAIGWGSRYPRNDGHVFDMTPEEREEQFEHQWKLGGLLFFGAFGDLVTDEEANEEACKFARKKIREIVKDPQVAERLSPWTRIFCKRVCADTGYFDTYNRDNVHLVDVKAAPIEEITEHGLRTSEQDYELDCLVYATGFDAMTGALDRMDIRGRGGQSLKEKWRDGPRTYLGLETAGFPNFFIINGPGSPSVLTNMLPSIEQHVEFIADCIDHLRQHELSLIEASPEAELQWGEHVNEVADETVFPSCNSWYLGANVPGKPRVFLPLLGYPEYLEKCDDVVANGYEGFVLS